MKASHFVPLCRSLVVAILLSSAAMPGQAQTLEESLAWLGTKTDVEGHYLDPGGRFYVRTFVSAPGGCTLRLHSRSELTHSTGKTTRNDWDRSLDLASYTGAEVLENGQLFPYPGTYPFVVRLVANKAPEYGYLVFSDRATAERVARALRHVIQLCRDKEPF